MSPMKMPKGDHLLKKQKLAQIRVDPKLKCCLTKKWKKKIKANKFHVRKRKLKEDVYFFL
jgi:hypothetical protein